METILKAGYFCENNEDPYLMVNNKYLNVYDIYQDLKNILEETEYLFLHGKYNQINKYLINQSGHPDGGTLYGIAFHQSEPAVGPFNTNEK